MLKKIKNFIAKETVLCIVAVCAVATMFLIPPDREYLHYIDFRVLCLLLCLMAVVAGLKAIGTFQKLDHAGIKSTKQLAVYLALFILCLLTVFRVIPYPVTTAVTVIVLMLLNKSLLKEIDYMLLLTFVCFFTVSENLGRVDSIRVFLQQLLQSNTLLTAVGTSQVISNVPAAIMLSGFTDQWHHMLAGVNIGGLGTPIASLASLITIKFYMRWPGAKVIRFLGFFTLANVIGLLVLLLVSPVFL